MISPRSPFKKSVGATLVALMVVTGAYSVAPRAHAGIPVQEVGLMLGSSIASKIADGSTAVSTGATAVTSSVTAVNSTMINTGTGPKNILDALAWTVAKTAENSLTKSVVNWINSGFQGSPAFVTDLKQNLGNLSDQIANDFFNDLTTLGSRATGVNLRSPLQDQVAAAVRQRYYQAVNSTLGFDAQHPYTLSSTCRDANGFTQGKNFNCGLNGWFALSQNPANNPMGRYQLAENALFMQLDSAVQQRKTELGWGKGFLSFRGSCGKSSSSALSHETGHTVSLTSGDPSAACPIKTPGSIIENTLGISATSPFRQLELADSINEIVAALAQQLVGQVLGSAGLSGVSQPSPGGGSSYINQTGNGSAQAGSLATGVLVDLENAITSGRHINATAQPLLAHYDRGIASCAAHPSEQAYLQNAKSDLQKYTDNRNLTISLLQELHDQIAAAVKANADPTTIQTLMTKYQSYVSGSGIPSTYPSKDQDAATQADAKRVDGEIDDYVSQNCTNSSASTGSGNSGGFGP